MPAFLPVETPERVARVAALARIIWNEHFVDLIGQAQVDYMLDRLQSAEAIAGQIADGVAYVLVRDRDEDAGYLAVRPEPDAGRMKLSKLYLRADRRGRGLGRAMLAYVEERCRATGLGELWLTVHKGNATAIGFYERMGFAVTGPLVADIGGGFVMDDHRMAKPVPPAPSER